MSYINSLKDRISNAIIESAARDSLESAKPLEKEVEQIDEISKDTLKSYKGKAETDRYRTAHNLWYKSVTDKDIKGKLALAKRLRKRDKGLDMSVRALKKKGTE